MNRPFPRVARTIAAPWRASTTLVAAAIRALGGTLRRVPAAFAAATLLALAAHVSDAAPRERGGPGLQVFAAASLAEAFGELGKVFEARHRGARVRFSFAGSQILVRQIEQGAHADVFASADTRTMEFLRERERLDGEPAWFAGNDIVVIVPRGNPARLTGLADLARPGVKIVIAAESVPAGAYARAAIAKLARTFGASYPRKVIANVVSQEENVRAVVGKVQLGEADAGFVYRTDAGRSLARFVRIVEIPVESNVVATYPIAVVRDTREPALARAFVDLVRSAEGQAVLRRHGFLGVDASR